MKLRTITSLTLTITLLLSVVTSLVMYIIPHGRVAYWSDWRLWGLGKTQWSELHLNLGILLLLAGFFHVYFNWRPIVNYLRNRSRKLTLFNANFSIALLLTAGVALGTYLQIPPLSTVIELNESIKQAAARKYGKPPYAHAELSALKTLAKRMDLDLEKSIRLLRSSGFACSGPDQTIQGIARQNELTPQQVYEVILAAQIKEKTGSKIPD